MTRTQHTPSVDFDAVHHLIEELSEHGRSDDEENLNNLLMERTDLLLKVSYYHTQCDEIASKCANLLAALESIARKGRVQYATVSAAFHNDSINIAEAAIARARGQT